VCLDATSALLRPFCISLLDKWLRGLLEPWPVQNNSTPLETLRRVLIGKDVVLLLGEEPGGRWRWVRWCRERQMKGLTEIAPMEPPSRAHREKRFDTVESAAAHFRRLLRGGKRGRS